MCKFEKVISRTLRCLSLSLLLSVAWGATLTSGAQPANDNFDGAKPLFNDVGTITGSNADATKEATELDSASFLNGASVWFIWVPQADGVVTFDTFGSDFDTLLEIYDGSVATGIGDLGSPLISNDDVDPAVFGLQNAGGVSSVTTNVVAGNIYYIVLGGFDGQTGSYNLNWKRGGLRASGEFEFTSTDYFASVREGLLDHSDANGNQSVNRDVPGVLITVTRKNGSSGRVLVDYETQEIIPDPFFPFGPVPAVPDIDFVPTSGTLVFEEFQMSASFIVPIPPKFLGTPDVFFTAFNVVLTNVSLATNAAGSGLNESSDLAPPIINPLLGTAIVGIADPNPFPQGPRDGPNGILNDQAGCIQFERAHYRRTEGVGTARIRVIRTGGTGPQQNASVSVLYRINRAGDPDNASSWNIFPLSAGSDYATPDTEDNGDYVVNQPPLQTLTIPASPPFAYIDIPIVNDSFAEFNEDIYIELVSRGPSASPSPKINFGDADTAASGYEIGFQNVAILTIMYDDYPAGALDPSYNPDYDPATNPNRNPAPGTDSSVYTVAVQPDGKSILGGGFANYNGVGRNGIARVNNNGSLDTTFNPGDGANGFISSLQVASDGKIVIGGGFTFFNGTQRNSIARLNANGTLDNTFNPQSGANGIVRSVAHQPDGKILIGGDFTWFNGTNINHFARLNADGLLDATFNSGLGADDIVFAIAVEADGSVLIGGDFTTVNGTNRQFIARLNTNGTLSTNFNIGTGANGTIYAIVPQPNGKILIGGAFREFNGEKRNSIARLNNDGSLDTTFDCGTGANDTVYAVALQPDGKVLLGGLFTSVNGTRRMGVARLFAHGPVDTSFLDTAYNQFAGLVNSYDNLAINPRNYVFALGLENNGNVIIGGGFSKVGGGRGSKDVRPEQYSTVADGFGDIYTSNFLDENTRATYRNRNNIARLIGGATPGPGNIEFASDTYSLDQNASPFFVPLVRTNYTTDTNYLGAVMASFTTRTLPAGSGAASGSDFSLNAKYGNPRWGSSWNRTNKLAWTRMQSDGFFGPNGDMLPFNDTYNHGELFPTEGEAFVFLDIAPGSAADGDKTLKLELTRPKGTRIFDEGGFTPLEFGFPAPLDFFSFPYFYFDPRDLDPLSLAQTDPNLEWSLGGEHIPLGTALGRSSATLTIRGSDTNRGVFTFSSPEFVVNEDGTNALIHVHRVNGSKNSASVQYATTDGTVPGFAAIRNLDYTPTNNTLTFGDKETNKTISIRILNDVLRENDESFTVRIFNPTDGAKLGAITNASVKIIDNDYLPGHLNFTLTGFAVGEEEPAAIISVARTGGSQGTLTVDYSTVPGGTATQNEDYIGVTNTLSWNNGDIATKTFMVPILNDGIVEGLIPETIFLQLTNTTLNGVLDPNPLGSQINAILNIKDDDRHGDFGFSSSAYFANENSGSTLITIIRTNGSAETVSITCLITNGASVTSSNLFFLPGELSKGLLISITDDFDQNGNTIIGLGLTNASPSTANITRPNAILTIVDDESFTQPPGSVDSTFDVSSGPNDFVYALALQPDGRILIGGDFTLVNNVPRNRVARLKTDGKIDAQFSSAAANFGADGSVRAIARQSNGRILIGGLFSTVNGINRSRIARLNSDGTTDVTFHPGVGADSAVHSIAETFSGTSRKILAAGNFTTFDGNLYKGLVQLNDNGTIDTSFNVGGSGVNGTNGTIYCVAVQPQDGKILIGGDFISFNGASRPRIARLNANGSIDTSFNPVLGPNASVRAIAVQTDGKILIGGLFTNVNGVAFNRIARLNANGSVDNTFTPGVGANDSVHAIALQLDGRIVLGGEFTQASGVTRNRLTRLNVDGTVDPSVNFGTGADSFVAAVAIDPFGRIVLAGGFTEFDGVATPRIARIFGSSIGGLGKIELTSANYQVNETEANAVISVRRFGGTTNTVSVTVVTSAGTAENGFDYTDVTTNLVFVLGETLKTFTIPIINDDFVESDETVHLALTLSDPTDHLGNQQTAVLTIKNDDAAISFSSPTYTFAENSIDGNAIIEIVRTGSSIGTASVSFTTTTNGTAITNLDYVAVSNTVEFADGETVKTVTIPLLPDSEIEGDETVTMELSNAFGAILTEPIAATLTIVDANFGPGVLSFLQPEYSVSEAGLLATITVVRTNGSSGFISVNYSATAGTASAGVDFAITNGTISFGPGELSKPFSVRIFDDTIPEGNETVNLTISNPTGGATINGTNTALLTIVDDDVALSFSTPAYVVNEGDGGVTITVRRDNGSNGIVTVFYETSDITATNNVDYIGKTNTASTTNSLVFVDGETFKTFTVPILEDALVEGDESFFVRLFSPTGAQLASPSNAVVTIVDNDSRLSFAAANYVVDENGTNVMVTVVRTNTSVGVVTVNFATSNGTATAGADYTATNGTLTFLEGEIAQTILIPIVNDASVEGDEEFTVRLSNPGGGAGLGEPSIATITIIDNDAGLRFSSPVYSVSESGVNATVTVFRTTVTNTTVSVNYSTANGTATAGLDYVTSLGLLTFTNGETVKTFTVPIIDDTAIEGDETILLTLLAPSPGSAIINPGAAVITIIDNDGSLVVPAGSALISESGPVNGVIDPSENVSLFFAFRNTVGANTANLVATLLPGGGITSPSGPQSYGVLTVNGASVSRPFSFTASGTNGQRITATFQLQDGSFDLGTATFTYTLGNLGVGFTNSSPIIINDSSSPPTTASPYPSTIDVSGIVGTVTKVSVTLSNISHTFFDDVDILLVSPAGQKIMLMSDVGGGNSILSRIITFDDSASDFFPDSIVFPSGTYKPTDYDAQPDLLFRVPAPAEPYASTLSVLNGSNPNGVWSLWVVDDTFFNNGSINNGWSLSIVSSSAFTPIADLSIAVTASPDPAATNNLLTYTVSVTNHGPSAATGVIVSNLLPPGVTYVSDTCNCGSNGTFVLPPLAKDGVAVFNIVVNPTAVGVITNIATVRANQDDPNLLNNTAQTVTTVDIPRADLAIAMSDSPDPVQINAPITYSLLVSNLGPAIAESVFVTNTLPPGTVFNPGSSSPGTQTNNQIIFALGTLIPGNSQLVLVVVTSTVPGTITNTASVGSPIIDPFKANNVAAVKTLVELPIPRLAVTPEGLSITWDTNAPGYIIESASDLSNPVWLPVTSSPVEVVNGQNRLIIDYFSERRFFRLSPQAP